MQRSNSLRNVIRTLIQEGLRTDDLDPESVEYKTVDSPIGQIEIAREKDSDKNDPWYYYHPTGNRLISAGDGSPKSIKQMFNSNTDTKEVNGPWGTIELHRMLGSDDDWQYYDTKFDQLFSAGAGTAADIQKLFSELASYQSDPDEPTIQAPEAKKKKTISETFYVPDWPAWREYYTKLGEVDRLTLLKTKSDEMITSKVFIAHLVKLARSNILSKGMRPTEEQQHEDLELSRVVTNARKEGRPIFVELAPQDFTQYSSGLDSYRGAALTRPSSDEEPAEDVSSMIIAKNGDTLVCKTMAVWKRLLEILHACKFSRDPKGTMPPELPAPKTP